MHNGENTNAKCKSSFLNCLGEWDIVMVGSLEWEWFIFIVIREELGIIRIGSHFGEFYSTIKPSTFWQSAYLQIVQYFPFSHQEKTKK
jgi:hypothetical protein